MLKLIKCEFWKLKRKRFVSFVIFSALLFPIPFTALVLKGSLGSINAFDGLFGMLITIGEQIMLPAILGIIAAMLFFMERDNNTLKNLRTIPVSPGKIATAKIAILFILGLIYSLVTVASAMVGGFIAGSSVGNVFYKLWLSAVTSVLYTAGTLPVVIAIVFFNRSYIFSIILTFFYTMFDFSLAYTGLASQAPVMKLLTSVMPAPIIYRWLVSQFVSKDAAFYSVIQPYFLSLPLVILIIAVLGGLSYFAIIKIYSKRES